MAIITYPLNGLTYDADDVQTYLCTRTSGVFASNSFDLSVTGDRQITISPGLAWVKNTNFSGKSVCLTEAIALTVPLADSALPRTDRVILRFDKAANTSSLLVKSGTPANDASLPSVEKTELIYELGLYSIYIPAGSTVLSAANITDTRLDETVCGLMRDGVTNIPTEILQNQVNDLLDQLRQLLNEVEDGSAYLLASNIITAEEIDEIMEG